MLRLTRKGPDSQIASSLCASCPHSPAGCCIAPPNLRFTDLARIVGLGGRDWLLAELAAGTLETEPRGLSIRRVTGRATDARGAPRIRKCAFHGSSGCTIDESRRSVTCNLYICESALHTDKLDADVARAARTLHAAVVADLVHVGTELEARVRDTFPEGPAYDAAFFDWLSAAWKEIYGAPVLRDTAIL